MTDELKRKLCARCINSDCDLNCIAKEEAEFGFECEHGEAFELYEENENEM